MHETRGRRAYTLSQNYATSCVDAQLDVRVPFFKKIFSLRKTTKAYNKKKKKTAHSGIEYLGFVRAFEYLAANFPSHQTIRFQRASFIQMFRPFERGRKKEYFTMRGFERISREIFRRPIWGRLRNTTYEVCQELTDPTIWILPKNSVVACRIISTLLPRDHCFRSIITDYWAATHRVLKFFVSFFFSFLSYVPQQEDKTWQWQIF